MMRWTSGAWRRGRGLGSALLDIAERLRQASGANGISLLVADSNAGARRLYQPAHGKGGLDESR
jgi:ribosomal protein S18 acetylase RimI-like enzyme